MDCQEVCVLQIIMDLREDTMENEQGLPRQAGEYVLDVKSRQASLTDAGLQEVYLCLSKLPVLLNLSCITIGQPAHIFLEAPDNI